MEKLIAIVFSTCVLSLFCLLGIGVIACLIFMFKKDDKQEVLNNKKWEEE